MPKPAAARTATKRPAPQTKRPAPRKTATPQEPAAEEEPPRALVTLRTAAAIQAAEAAGMCVATAFSAAATISGKSYQVASGIALTLIAFGTAVALAIVARGLARAKPWSRSPALITQLFAGGAGIYLLDGHRLDWGVPTLILAGAGLAALLSPASFKALNRGR
jgi:hypothetical protein